MAATACLAACLGEASVSRWEPAVGGGGWAATPVVVLQALTVRNQDSHCSRDAARQCRGRLLIFEICRHACLAVFCTTWAVQREYLVSILRLALPEYEPTCKQ